MQLTHFQPAIFPHTYAYPKVTTPVVSPCQTGRFSSHSLILLTANIISHNMTPYKYRRRAIQIQSVKKNWLSSADMSPIQYQSQSAKPRATLVKLKANTDLQQPWMVSNCSFSQTTSKTRKSALVAPLSRERKKLHRVQSEYLTPTERPHCHQLIPSHISRRPNPRTHADGSTRERSL